MDDIREIVRADEKQRFSLIPNPATHPHHPSPETSNEASSSPAAPAASSSSSSMSEAPPSSDQKDKQSSVPETDEPSHYLIRANQGHSITFGSGGDGDGSSGGGGSDHLTALTTSAGNVPSTVVHGTFYAFWPSIVETGGLKPMGRTHVHCAKGLPQAQGDGDGDGGKKKKKEEEEEQVISGMRKDAELLVYVDVEKCLAEEPDIRWWISENGVVLSEGGKDGIVPLRVFREVVGRRRRNGVNDDEEVGVLVRDGVVVADLPQGLKIKVPFGKGTRGGHRGSNKR